MSKFQTDVNRQLYFNQIKLIQNKDHKFRPTLPNLKTYTKIPFVNLC